jgi:hypothetical protein
MIACLYGKIKVAQALLDMGWVKQDNFLSPKCQHFISAVIHNHLTNY